jgi:phage FluMu protein Com
MNDLKEYRCIACDSLLYKYAIKIGKQDCIVIEIKCPKCNSIKLLEIDLIYLLNLYSKLKKHEKNKKQLH